MYNFSIACKQLQIPNPNPHISTPIYITEPYKLPYKLPYNNTYANNVIDTGLCNSITTAKRDIDRNYKNGDWDYVKTLTNPYEFVFSGSKKFAGRDIRYIKNNICDYNPLSRSFFKMIEMANVFLLPKVVKNTKAIKTLHLAEGPGGFIEAIIYLRKKYASHIQASDYYYGITLNDTDNIPSNDIPNWKKTADFMKREHNFIVTYGTDGTGNLYNKNNIIYLRDRFYNTMDLVTADGGFDFSTDYNCQEYSASQLIYSEIMGAMATLKAGGIFICKFFDIINKLTTEFLYILQCKFEYIYIFKPKTSRLANSEKYVICVNYRGSTELELDTLFGMIDTFSELANTNKIINTMFDTIPAGFVKFITGISNQIIAKQVANINNTISLIYNIKHRQITSQSMADIINNQKINARAWCKINNMPYISNKIP